jgi:hypothetical protein
MLFNGIVIDLSFDQTYNIQVDCPSDGFSYDQKDCRYPWILEELQLLVL